MHQYLSLRIHWFWFLLVITEKKNKPIFVLIHLGITEMIPAKCLSLHTLVLFIACHHLPKKNSQLFVLTNVGITDMIPAKYRPVALGGVLTGIWQCVAVCCSVLQCVAACGTAWQCCAVCCRLLRSLKTIVQWH